MLNLNTAAAWVDFKEDELDLNDLSKMDLLTDFSDHKLVLVVHCLFNMVQMKGTQIVQDRTASKYGIVHDIAIRDVDSFSYLSDCSQGRLREWVNILLPYLKSS